MIPRVSGVSDKGQHDDQCVAQRAVELRDRHGTGSAGHRVPGAIDHGGLDLERGEQLEE